MLVGMFWGTQAIEGRPWRPENIPNGWVFNCQNCHEDPNGGGTGTELGNQIYLSRNAFPDPPNHQGVVVWGPLLASLDADGDGFTNGEELGDPQGVWAPNGPPPLVVNPNLVSNPGDRSSIPPVRPNPPGESGVPVDPPAPEPVAIALEGLLVDGTTTVPNSRIIEVAEVWLFEIQVSATTVYIGFEGETLAATDVSTGDEVRVSGFQLLSSIVQADTLRLAIVEPLDMEEHSADFDNDGTVGFSDFLLFADAYGSRFGEQLWDFTFDLVLDGRVDFQDFLDFLKKFNKPPEGTPLEP